MGVDVRRAEKPCHQLVGDVIVFGEQLAGEVESDRIRSVPREDALKAGGDPIERHMPIHTPKPSVPLPQHGIEQTFGKGESLAERRALRADAPEIGGTIGISWYAEGAVRIPSV